MENTSEQTLWFTQKQLPSVIRKHFGQQGLRSIQHTLQSSSLLESPQVHLRDHSLIPFWGKREDTYSLGMQLGHISRDTGTLIAPAWAWTETENGGKGKIQEKDRKTCSLGEREVANKHAACRHSVQTEQDLFTWLFQVEDTAGLNLKRNKLF